MKKLIVTVILSINFTSADFINGTSNLDIQTAIKKFKRLLEIKDLSEYDLIANHILASQFNYQITPSYTIIFGSPNTTSPIIACNPKLALELPFKIVFWQENGKTKVGFENFKAIAKRYNALNCPNIDTVETLQNELFKAITKWNLSLNFI